MLQPASDSIKEFLLNYVYPCRNCPHHNTEYGCDRLDYDTPNFCYKVGDIEYADYLYAAYTFDTCLDCGGKRDFIKGEHIRRNSFMLFCNHCKGLIVSSMDNAKKCSERYGIPLDKLLNKSNL